MGSPYKWSYGPLLITGFWAPIVGWFGSEFTGVSHGDILGCLPPSRIESLLVMTVPGSGDDSKLYTLPKKTNSSHPKMDGWKMNYHEVHFGMAYFLGRTVSCRECISHEFSRQDGNNRQPSQGAMLVTQNLRSHRVAMASIF